MFNSSNVQVGTNAFVTPAADGSWTWNDTATTRAVGNYSLKATIVSATGTTAVNSTAPVGRTGGGYDQQDLQIVAGPTIAITSSTSSIQNGGTATITFELSAASKDFDASDVAVSGGVLSAFAGAAGFGDAVNGYTKYTATFTSNSASANGVINVASDRFSDATGYANADGAEPNNTATLSNIVGALNQARMGWEVGVIFSGYWNDDMTTRFGFPNRAGDLTLEQTTLPAGLSSITVYVYNGGSVMETINWDGRYFRNGGDYTTSGNLTAKAFYNGVYYNFAWGRSGSIWNQRVQFDSTSPLVVDLNGDGIQTVGLAHSVLFDLNASGSLQKTAWLDARDGFLVLDHNQNGVIDSGLEMFGNHTRLPDGSMAASGWQALAAVDGNGDGRIDSADAVFRDLRIWVDADSDGQTDRGELHGLQDFSIESLDVVPTPGQTVQNGNVLDGEARVIRTDGSPLAMSDVWFEVEVNAGLLDLTGAALPEGGTLANHAALRPADVLRAPIDSLGVHRLEVLGDDNDTLDLLVQTPDEVGSAAVWLLQGRVIEEGRTFDLYHYSLDAALELRIDHRLTVVQSLPVLG